MDEIFSTEHPSPEIDYGWCHRGRSSRYCGSEFRGQRRREMGHRAPHGEHELSWRSTS